MMLKGQTKIYEGNQDSGENRPKGLFKEFLYDITPLHKDDWDKAGRFTKIILVLRIPFMFLLQLCVPTVNSTSYNYGWSKLLNCVQVMLTPLIALVVLKSLFMLNLTFPFLDHQLLSFSVWYLKVLRVPLWIILFAISFFFGALIFLTTTVAVRPKYHNVSLNLFCKVEQN